ncbi:hypothetical protein GF378_00990 [Candidatus Pacearchaeota archaeon]|nr:hypothetical protein [Candidatus Pacearchaeota archaeon]
MVHKRYVRKNGKLHGPYLYKSYRDKNGKVRKKYLGKAEETDKKIVFMSIVLGFLMLFSFSMVVRTFIHLIL